MESHLPFPVDAARNCSKGGSSSIRKKVIVGVGKLEFTVCSFDDSSLFLDTTASGKLLWEGRRVENANSLIIVILLSFIIEEKLQTYVRLGFQSSLCVVDFIIFLTSHY